ncbi:hypothetical protein B0T22DRAFT_494184 [Podospora appendiculata]|uniref:Histone acetyltransferase n=1 Tax=Podospora appendiculata TaxID=314037 RepID=A0AAE0X144_9PEZI|nr:hypothetical protein B0T22DRAFT_494184 [Podospora appendiculata]
MTDAQLMEEELQQSVMMAEQLEDPDVADVIMDGEEAASATIDHIDVEAPADDDEDMDGDEEDEEEYDRRKDEDEDLDDDDDDDDERLEGEEHSDNSEEEEDEEDGFDDDAEGEDDDDVDSRAPQPQERNQSQEDEGDEQEDNDEDDDDDDEDEGVGAVKIKPGETDDEDDSDASSISDSESISDVDSEVSEGWDEVPEKKERHDGRDEDDDDDDESENANNNVCIFCKQDEDHDPGVEFEAYLSCSSCGDNAHQQCAREADALSSQQSPAEWKCPHCTGERSETAARVDADNGEPNGMRDVDVSPSSSRRATAPKLARDLLPPQKGAIKPDSHSVFNHLVLDEDPMDGSRVLRKRKTSSVDVDDNLMALRKRRRNTADGQSDDGTNGHDEAARPVSSRSLRIKISNPPVSVQRKSRTSIIVRMRVEPTELRRIVTQKPRTVKKRSDRAGGRSRRTGASRATGASAPSASAAFAATSYSQPFYSFYDKETDELKGKPYGGILTEAEADTSKTLPTNDDRRRFDEAKQKAEEEWRQRLLKMQAEIEVPAARRSKKASGPASQIECIEFGGWEIDTWYAAPYPEEYSRNRVLYICEFCLKYMNSDYVAWRHKLKCPAKHPPGDEIYRHDSISVFEVDGRKNPVYCQNLCLLAKLFLGSKTLYYDVEPFLFYVLCEYDDLGYHFVGYFSKEKRASSQNNVSCILTLPIHQRKGYGNLLIDFSYLLTRVEQKTGSPEKPLSDMGLVSYRNYWRLVMCRYLQEHFSDNETEKKGLSIKNISDDTGLTPDDVISALEGLRCLVRDPQTHLYAFRVDQRYCREYVATWEAKKYVQLNPSALTWTPYVMGRSNATNFELGPAINAIAPREDGDEQKAAAPAVGTLVNGNGVASLGKTEATSQPVKVDVDPGVLESTEPNETGKASDHNTSPKVVGKPNGTFAKVNGNGKGNGAHDEDAQDPEENSKDASEDWISQYKDIPPSRFEVVPPIAGTRRADRVRTTVARPPVIRTASSISRPRPKRSDSGRRSSAANKPKSTSKRKSGGTGRGPGRWPKGTKKSDYGNADSGPGLPPAWLEKRAASLTGGKKDGADAKDTVQVLAPSGKETKSQSVADSSSASTRRNGSSGEGSVSKGKRSPRSQSSRSLSSKENNSNTSNSGADVVMADAEDARRDGEDEDEDEDGDD